MIAAQVARASRAHATAAAITLLDVGADVVVPLP